MRKQFLLTSIGPWLRRSGDFLKGVFRVIWNVLWYPAALPVVVILALTGASISFGHRYHQLVREAITYQDSIVRAQDAELWRLRGDTLEANFEIRELYKRLDDREKAEVIYFDHLHRADDTQLQSDLDSLFNRHLTAPRGLPSRAPAPPQFNLVNEWGQTSPVRSLSGR